MNQTLDTQTHDSATARRLFEQADKAQQAGDRLKAIELLEEAYEANPEDAQICFQLAYQLDLQGEEEEAITLYTQAIDHEKPHLNALLNLAVLREDRNELLQAEKCLRQVLATDPNHARARLYLKDVIASRSMVIHDEQERDREVHDALLDTPVTDFELTVRTRNTLAEMSIATLGDLVRHTEAELRNFKNFGEASLEEVRAMLSQKGLRLGMLADQQQEEARQHAADQIEEQGGDQSVLSQAINELGLSVRARKALSLLNVQNIGELVSMTEAELLGIKNFGVTSLVEIKEKLESLGLNLRTLDQ